jgi:hypothetical protein
MLHLILDASLDFGYCPDFGCCTCFWMLHLLLGGAALQRCGNFPFVKPGFSRFRSFIPRLRLYSTTF